MTQHSNLEGELLAHSHTWWYRDLVLATIWSCNRHGLARWDGCVGCHLLVHHRWWLLDRHRCWLLNHHRCWLLNHHRCRLLHHDWGWWIDYGHRCSRGWPLNDDWRWWRWRRPHCVGKEASTNQPCADACSDSSTISAMMVVVMKAVMMVVEMHGCLRAGVRNSFLLGRKLRCC